MIGWTRTTLTSAAELAQQHVSVAVLPVGSFEQHGPYLPLATDTIIACAIAETVAQSHPVILLPPITVSCSHEHAAFAGTISISATTLLAVVSDIADSLAAQDVNAVAIVNGHGGNYALRNYAQQASAAGRPTAVFPGPGDYAAARAAAGLTHNDHDDMHGGELETSILLHALPEAVGPGNATADHGAPDRHHLLTAGMAAYTASGVIGFPSHGTAAKGAAILNSLADAFAPYLAALNTGWAAPPEAEGRRTAAQHH